MNLSISVETIRKALHILYESADDLQSHAVRGAYAGIYSIKTGQAYGETTAERLGAGEIFIHANGTPTAGASFLRSYELTGDSQFLAAATDVGRALAAAQKPIGGWYYTQKSSGMGTDPTVTLDDNVTQGSLELLMALDKHVDAEWLDGTIEKGLDFLVDFQAANGGWQQRYPSKGDYHDHFTFNDSAIPATIEVLVEAYKQYGDKSYRQAAEKGAEFILATQTRQGGWAQQYDKGLKPVTGRKFEPAAVASAESASVLKALLSVYEIEKDPRYLATAQSAVDWLSGAMLPSGEWARMYEIGSNRPIFVTRDGKISYAASQGASSYRWLGDFGVHDAIQQFTLLTVAPERYSGLYASGLGDEVLVKATTLQSKAASAIRDYDKSGWLTGSYLHTADVAESAGYLQNYLGAARKLLEAEGKGATWDALLADAAAGKFKGSGAFDADVRGTVVIANAGNDRLSGTEADDVMLGGAGRDTLSGGDGNDIIVGGVGADSLNGAAGRDRVDFSVSSAAVTVNLDRGVGERGDARGDRYASIEDAVGSRFADRLYGSGGANRLDGGAGDDELRGRGGDDRLLGGDGRDYLAGEAGRDVLSGGAGADRFDFDKLTESVVGPGRDVIADFARGDLIDLFAIDANSRAGGDQAFGFIGAARFTGRPGELHAIRDGSAVIVEGDVNGDRLPDFQIQLDRVLTLTAGDFLL